MQATRFALALALAGGLAFAPAAEAKKAKGMEADAGAKALVATGTKIDFILEEPISSATAKDGDVFSAPVKVGWFKNRALKGVILEGHVEGVKAAGRLGKKGELDVVVDDILFPDGHTAPLEAKLLTAVKPKGTFLRNAGIIMGGAIAGHHIGKKTDKKHGALMGAAAATAVVLTMKAGDVELPKGTVLTVQVEKDVLDK